jgi:peptidoglycan/LPS O-acetylase OafA/YrhL
LFGPTPPFERYGWREIAASLLSLENVVGQPIGSDGPLWSLGFEWMFYLAFAPLLWLADRAEPARRWAARGAVALGSAALLALLHMPYLGLLWLIWLAGALAQTVARSGRWPPALRWAGAGVCLLGFGLGLKIDYHLADAVIGLGFAAFLCRWPSGERGLNLKLDHAFAAASYSLYVTHLPVIAFVGMVFVQIGWLGSHGAASGPHLMIMLATALLASGAAALMVHRLFERRTEQVRRWLAAALIPAPARAARTALVEP